MAFKQIVALNWRLQIDQVNAYCDESDVHYANTPMQYTAIFHGCKNVKFQMKKYNVFLIFA